MSPVGSASATPVVIAAVFTVALLAWMASPVEAQIFMNPGMPSSIELSDSVQVDEADSATKTHLERVRAFAANEQWDEVIETLCQVMESQGEKVVGLELRPYMQPYLRLPSYGLKHYLSVRDYCQIQLANLPPKHWRYIATGSIRSQTALQRGHCRPR